MGKEVPDKESEQTIEQFGEALFEKSTSLEIVNDES